MTFLSLVCSTDTSGACCLSTQTVPASLTNSHLIDFPYLKLSRPPLKPCMPVTITTYCSKEFHKLAVHRVKCLV